MLGRADQAECSYEPSEQTIVWKLGKPNLMSLTTCQDRRSGQKRLCEDAIPGGEEWGSGRGVLGQVCAENSYIKYYIKIFMWFQGVGVGVGPSMAIPAKLHQGRRLLVLIIELNISVQ